MSATDLTASVEEALECTPPRADGLLLPDARIRVRGGGRGPGDDDPRLARGRSPRRARGAARMAVPHRPQRLPRHAQGLPAARAPDGPRSVVDRGDDARRRPLVEQTWIMPIQDSSVLPTDGDPAEMAAAKETIRLAFVAALQICRPSSAPCSSCARSSSGRPARSPSCSRPASRRSTARCSGRARRSRPPTSTRRRPRRTSTATRSATCSPATSTRSRATTSRRSSRS